MACQDSQWMMEQLWEHFEFYEQITYFSIINSENPLFIHGDFYDHYYIIRQQTKMANLVVE